MKATIVACVILQYDNKYLLVQQARSRRVPGKWGPPGGKPLHEKGESFLQAARREAFEEIGRQVELTGFIGLVRSSHRENPNLFVCFGARLQNTTEYNKLKFKEGEISAGRWFTLAEIEEAVVPLRSEPLAVMYRRHSDGLIYPLEIIEHETLEKN